jgi:hypothetical protein
MAKLPRLLVAGFSFIAATWAAEAHASFVCEVRLNPQLAEGDFGSITLRITANANCGGADQGTFHLCSQGASSPSCTSATAFHFPEAGLIAVFEALQRAAAADQFVTVSTFTCQLGGGSNCATNVDFRSN